MTKVKTVLTILLTIFLLAGCSIIQAGSNLPASSPLEELPTDPTAIIPQVSEPATIPAETDDASARTLSFLIEGDENVLNHYDLYLVPAGRFYSLTYYPIHIDRSTTVTLDALSPDRTGYWAYVKCEGIVVDQSWTLLCEYRQDYCGSNLVSYSYHWSDSSFVISNQKTLLTLEPKANCEFAASTLPGDILIPVAIPFDSTENSTGETDFSLSFFMMLQTPADFASDWYISPLGTDEWYKIEVSDAHCNHQHAPGIESTYGIRRVYVACNYTEGTEWILKKEVHWEDETGSHTQTDIWYDHPFTIINNQTFLDRLFVSDPAQAASDGLSTVYPDARPMEFCENCPESWREPIG